MVVFQRKRRKGSSYTSGVRGVPTGSKKQTIRALLGPNRGPACECLTECIKCHHAIVLLVPDKPIPDVRPQMVFKHQCSFCGQELYAVTNLNDHVMLASNCSVVDEKMYLDNPVELNILVQEVIIFESYGGTKLNPTPFIVGRGLNGKMAMLSLQDLGLQI